MVKGRSDTDSEEDDDRQVVALRERDKETDMRREG